MQSFPSEGEDKELKLLAKDKDRSTCNADLENPASQLTLDSLAARQSTYTFVPLYQMRFDIQFRIG